MARLVRVVQSVTEIQSFHVDLGDGVEFRYHGPQTDRRLYYGTVGPDPTFNRKVIDRLMRDRNRGQPGDWHGRGSSLTSLSTSASPWTLIEFEEPRLLGLIEWLREIVREV